MPKNSLQNSLDGFLFDTSPPPSQGFLDDLSLVCLRQSAKPPDASNRERIRCFPSVKNPRTKQRTSVERPKMVLSYELEYNRLATQLHLFLIQRGLPKIDAVNCNAVGDNSKTR